MKTKRTFSTEEKLSILREVSENGVIPKNIMDIILYLKKGSYPISPPIEKKY
ncbi:MAG: hypothetical protein ACK5H1_06285 [Tenacibaculum sp.]